MVENLDNRKKRILQAIIEEYIDTAEPVSSGNLVKELNCSSATIRNEMAELEKIGYIEKPYTSAGRIPSQKGYRYYIDELLRDDKLTKKEMQYIKTKLETTVNELEDLTKIATTTLSELTHYTTIAIGPKIENHTILDVKFVLLGSRVMMAIILTDSGIIREAIIKFDEDVTEEQIRNLNTIFANHMVGRPIDQVGDNIEDFITAEMKNSISLIKKIIEEIDHHTTEKIRRKIDNEITRYMPRKVILDFNKVSFMDSAGIGMIIGRYKMIKMLGGELEIENATRSVRKVLEMSGITKIISLKEGEVYA